MPYGFVNTPTVVQLAGLLPAVTDNTMQMFCKDQAPLKNMGYVTRDKKIRLFLWNGTGADVTLTGVTVGIDADGVETSALPPDIILANTSRAIDVTVTTDGPLEFTAILDFVSACLSGSDLTLVGTRAPQLSGDVGYLVAGHNWENGFDESLEWKTDVLVAHDRTEQRIQLRTLPRRAWELRYLLSGAARRKFESWLGMRKTRYLFSPVWRDEGRTTGPVVAGSSTVPVATEYLDFAIGRWVAVYDSWDHLEIRTITGIAPGYVAVDAPFVENWPAGVPVAPCRYGVCLEQWRVSRFTEDVGDFRIRFEVLHESAMPAMASPELYRSLPLCPATPSWVDKEEAWDNKWVRLDNETGIVEYDVQSLEPVISRDARFVLIGRDKIDTFLRFIFSAAGRLRPFWLAADGRGFELSAPADQDDTVITIAPIGYEYSLSGSSARSNLELITTGGTIIRRMVTGVQTLPSGDEQLTLDSALPEYISDATLNRCAWLELVRLDADKINLHWISGECLEITLPIMVLP